MDPTTFQTTSRNGGHRNSFVVVLMYVALLFHGGLCLAEVKSVALGRMRFDVPAELKMSEVGALAFGYGLDELEYKSEDEEFSSLREGEIQIFYRNGGSHVATRGYDAYIRKNNLVLRVRGGFSKTYVYAVPESVKPLPEHVVSLKLKSFLNRYELGVRKGAFCLKNGCIDKKPAGRESISANYSSPMVTIYVKCDSEFPLGERDFDQNGPGDPSEEKGQKLLRARKVGVFLGQELFENGLVAQSITNDPDSGYFFARRKWRILQAKPSPHRPNVFIEVSGSVGFKNANAQARQDLEKKVAEAYDVILAKFQVE